jgi:hypothetical protein
MNNGERHPQRRSRVLSVCTRLSKRQREILQYHWVPSLSVIVLLCEVFRYLI